MCLNKLKEWSPLVEADGYVRCLTADVELVVLLPPTGRGGKGWKWCYCSLSCVGGGLRCNFVRHTQRPSSPPSSLAGLAAISTPPWWRSSGPCAGARRLEKAKWFVPGNLEMADISGSLPEKSYRAPSSLISALLAPGGHQRLVVEAP